MQLPEIKVSVKAKLKFDTQGQINKFKKFIQPYHQRGLKMAVKAMKDTIVEKDAKTSGQLFESVVSSLFNSSTGSLQGGILFKKPGSEYAAFVDKGRRPGKMPPVDKIETWMENFNGFSENSGYAVAMKIKKKGIQGKKFFRTGKARAIQAYKKAVNEGLTAYRGKK